MWRVFVSERGNVFMREIADHLVEALAATGRDAELVTDRLPEPIGPGDSALQQLVVAPHEFFVLFPASEIDRVRAASHAVCINTEQQGTPFFDLAMQYARHARVVLDINTPTSFDAGVLAALLGGTYPAYVAANAAAWNAERPANGTNDYISIGGNLSLGTGAGTVTMNGDITGSGIGSIFKLMDWASIGTQAPGGFNSSTDVNLSGLTTGGASLDFSFLNTYGFVVVVPEPSRVLLVLFGLLGLAFRRRRAGW